MLDRLRVRVEQLLGAVARERLAQATAEPRESRLGAIFRSAAELFRLDRISEIQLRVAGASGDEERRLRHLLESLAHGRAECAAASELDAYRTWRANGHLVVGERRVPVRAARWVAAQTADPEARRAIHDAYLEALTDQRDTLEGLASRRREALEELGYGSYLAATQVLGEIDLRALARDAERFLGETEAGYRELLDWHLPRLAGVEPGDAREVDGLRLRRAAPLDPLFLGRNLAAGLMGALAGSGLDPLAGGRIHLRTRVERPEGPGAAVYAIRVPEEVVLLVSPHAGRPVHAAFLRALGEALQHAYTSPEVPLECRRLGDGSTPLAFGRLLEGLLENPALLDRYHQVPRARLAELRRTAALLLLLRTRRAAAQLRYETEWLEEPQQVPPGRYAELLTEATRLRHDPRGALASVGPAFRVARHLRGEQLASVLIRYLRERHDEDWFRNPRAGETLVELMGPGRTYTASELAVQVGSAPLSFAPLRERIAELLA